MKLVGGVELPKTDDIMSTLEEQTIPQTVCWAFMPVTLHRISFLNMGCNSMITPPASDKNTSGGSQAFQQLRLWRIKGSVLHQCGSASSIITVKCLICCFCEGTWTTGYCQGSDKCLFNVQAYEVWVETDHNKIKFQWACLLCLLLCMYKWKKIKSHHPSGIYLPPAFLSLPSIQLQCSEDK